MSFAKEIRQPGRGGAGAEPRVPFPAATTRPTPPRTAERSRADRARRTGSPRPPFSRIRVHRFFLDSLPGADRSAGQYRVQNRSVDGMDRARPHEPGRGRRGRGLVPQITRTTSPWPHGAVRCSSGCSRTRSSASAHRAAAARRTITEIMVNAPNQIYIERERPAGAAPTSRSATTSTSCAIIERIVVAASAAASTSRRRWWTPACRTARASTPSFRRWRSTGPTHHDPQVLARTRSPSTT